MIEPFSRHMGNLCGGGEQLVDLPDGDAAAAIEPQLAGFDHLRYRPATEAEHLCCLQLGDVRRARVRLRIQAHSFLCDV